MELSLSKLPWYGQIGAFVAISCLAVFGFYSYYAQPAMADLDARRSRLERMRVDINRGVTTARMLPEFQSEVTELEERLESLKAVLPEQKDVADLLRRIQTLATQSSLTIRGFKPRAIATQQLHAEWPIEIELEGTYHNLGFFFDRVSKFQRIINVTDIRIQAKDRPEPNATITAACVATTFVLLETPPRPAGPAPVPGR